MNILLQQIEELERQAKKYMKKNQKLLQTIPGIGPVWAPTILAEVLPVFHPEEKNGARKLVAAAGLDVRPNVNGKNKGKGEKHLVAISHVANKLLHVVFSVLKNQKPYEVHFIH